MNNRTKLLQFLLCVTLIFLQLSFINAQNAKIDSLQKINLNYNKSDKKKVDILNELSHTISPFDITLAKEYAESAKAISEEINYINGLCNSYNNLGSTYRVSNKEMALDYFTKGLYLSKENNFNSIVNSLIGIGNIKYRQNFINEADSLYKEAYDLSIKFKDDLLIAKSLFNMSIIESKKLNYKEAINLLDRAGESMQNNKDYALLSKIYFNTSLYYNIIGNQQKSLEKALKAIDASEIEGNKGLLIDTYINLGGLHFARREYESSIENINKAYDIAKELNDSTKLSSCLSRLGNVYIQMNEEKGLTYLKEALSLLGEKRSSTRIHIILSIAGYYSLNNSYEQAQYYLDRAIKENVDTNNLQLSAYIWNQFAVLRYYEKNYYKAIEYANKTKEITDKTKNNDLRKSAYGILSESNAELNKFKDAYHYLGEWKLLSDSILNANNIRKIALMESAYKHDKEIQLYESEKTSNKLKIRNQRQLIIFISLMTIFIALSLIFVFINARLKKRLLRLEINNANKTIQTNNKEMAAATLKLLQNSEKDNHCLKLLEEIESKVNNENKDMVKNLMSHYRKKSDDSNWAEFDTLFKKVSPKFYDKLNDLYPNLTPNERKLCVFLKLNMTNKDITKITFQSEEALKKARLRLRKKLNLERDINLSSFMQTL